MELLRRDTRYLRGTTPRVDVPPPQTFGHVVDSWWDDGVPVLVVRDAAGASHRLPLVGDLNIEVLEARHCVGRWRDGRLLPCPFDAVADHFDQCPACHPLPDRECVFNPRCTNCTHELCNAPHHLYLAFYGELPKVGMTRAARGDARLVEQGADAFAVIGRAGDRAEARRLEDLVTQRLGIPQARRAEELLSRVARDVPWTAIENAYAQLRPRLGDLLGQAPGPLERIPHDDDTFPLPSVPNLAGVHGHHAGRILGAKGRYVFYRVERADPEQAALEPIWALNVHALVTHHVHFDARTAERVPG